MSQAKWAELRKWLFSIFPESEAQEMYDEHVAEARAAGLEVPS